MTSNLMNSLQDRINKVIHTHAFEDVLCEGGWSLERFKIDFAIETPTSFDQLPELYQQAVLAGEAERND